MDGMVRNLPNITIAHCSFHKTFKELPLSECSRFKVKKLLMQLVLNKY